MGPPLVALPEIPQARLHLRWGEARELLHAAVENSLRHKIPRLAASLAFYTILSLAPTLVVVVWIGALFFSQDAAIGQLTWQIQDWVGYDVAAMVAPMIKAAQHPSSGPGAAVLSFLAL